MSPGSPVALRWLIDEMLSPATAAELAALGHEALTVAEAGLGGSDGATVYETAVEQQRVIVTENFADFATITNDRLTAGAPCVPVVFVRKRQHPVGAQNRVVAVGAHNSVVCADQA